jgi:cellulose synthase/poly-beta-1,6-N-acetylglucosamine synthase-like glycosyltransferase
VKGCNTLTEVMPTWADLFRQRLRWQRGTLTDLRTYGVSFITVGYWLKQIFIYTAIAATVATWVIMCISFRQDLAVNIPWSIAIGSLTLLERLVTVRKAGIWGMLLALALIPEFCYDLFKLSFFMRALYDNMRRRDVFWNHVVKGDA